MNARHRVSKMLLRHGRVYPKQSTWTHEHRRWLAAQQFPEPMSELAWADLIACVDGLTARKKTIAERISELATDPAWWPTVARLRAFRGMDTLTALAVHLELGADWQRFEKAHRVGSWLGLTPARSQSGERDYPDRSRRPGPSSPADCSSRPPGTTPANPGSERRSPTASKDSPTTSCRSPTVASSACTTSTPACGHAANTTTSRASRSRGSCPASSGPPRPHPEPAASPAQTAAPPAQEAGTPGRHSGRHAR